MIIPGIQKNIERLILIQAILITEGGMNWVMIFTNFNNMNAIDNLNINISKTIKQVYIK